jgi:hypothetical protein
VHDETNEQQGFIMQIHKIPAWWAVVTVMGLAGCGGGGAESDSGSTPTTSKPNPAITISDKSFKEGDSTNNIVVPISRNSSSVTSSVKYRLTAGTAVEGSDFVNTSGTITFPINETKSEIIVALMGDKTYEDNEDFRIELYDAETASISRTTAKITVQNDDVVPTVEFVKKLQYTTEESTGVVIGLTLSNPTDKDVVVPLNLSGTATLGLDYTATETESVIIPALIETATILVDIIADTIPEGGESIKIGFGTLENASRGKTSDHQIVISGQTALNDTGYVSYTNGSSFDLTIEPSSHPFQDASHGRDATLDDDVDGVHAMSFTKLDLDGNALPPTDPDFNCVRDNITGTVFEVKEGYNRIDIVEENGRDTAQVLFPYRYRSSSFRYYWYNDDIDPENTGGSIGHLGELFNTTTGTAQKITHPDVYLTAYIPEIRRPHRIHPNTEAYQNEVNWRGLCGFKDWRLPTVGEIRSIANYDAAADPDDGFLDPDYFPYGLPDTLTSTDSVEYFTSNPSSENDASAWCLNSVTGTARLCHKGTAHYVRLVRSGE